MVKKGQYYISARADCSASHLKTITKINSAFRCSAMNSVPEVPSNVFYEGLLSLQDVFLGFPLLTRGCLCSVLRENKVWLYVVLFLGNPV